MQLYLSYRAATVLLLLVANEFFFVKTTSHNYVCLGKCYFDMDMVRWSTHNNKRAGKFFVFVQKSELIVYEIFLP